MDIQITPGPLSGSVTPPPSKSQSHRLLIAASLAGERSYVRRLADSKDIEATRRCMDAMLSPVDLPLMDCGESGSTLRFLIPLALVLRGGGRFTGHGRLMERPQGPYQDLIRAQGNYWNLENGVLTVEGNLSPGVISLPGNVSSQFITGLLFALPFLDEDSEIRLTTALESQDYVDMTLEVLHKFAIRANWIDDRTLWVRGNQRYAPAQVTAEADWSQAAFWYAANFLDSALQIEGLNFGSSQGDKSVLDFATQLAQPGDVTLDLADYPDLVPPLAVMAATRSGTARFVNIARLRLKESDRIATTTALVNALGGQAQEESEGLVLHGVPALTGGTVDGANDHRIVMAAAIAATRCQTPVTILGTQAVSKSYPTFFEEFQRLGGMYHVL